MCPRPPNSTLLPNATHFISNACDSCPANAAPDDADSDGICNAADRCPGFNDATDPDVDGIPSGCDNCPSVSNNNQLDSGHDTSRAAVTPCTDLDCYGV